MKKYTAYVSIVLLAYDALGLRGSVKYDCRKIDK